jgi:hypothetical protein
MKYSKKAVYRALLLKVMIEERKKRKRLRQGLKANKEEHEDLFDHVDVKDFLDNAE